MGASAMLVRSADMVRVGALRRISKSLLPHSLHAVDSKAKSDAVSELKDMLAGSTTAAEAALIQRELDQLKQVHEFVRAHKHRVKGVWDSKPQPGHCAALLQTQQLEHTRCSPNVL